MNLTTAQLTTLGNAIRANGSVATELAAGNIGGIRDWYNGESSPSFWVLKPDVAVDDMVSAMDWATDYAAFKDDIPAIGFLLSNGTYDPQQPNARDALNAVFAGATATKAAVLALATRIATEAEKLFAVTTTGPGGGNGTAQSTSAIAEVVGSLTTQNVDLALEATQ